MFWSVLISILFYTGWLVVAYLAYSQGHMFVVIGLAVVLVLSLAYDIQTIMIRRGY